MKTGTIQNVGAHEIMQVGILGMLKSGMHPSELMEILKKDVADIWVGLQQEKNQAKRR